MQLASGTYSMTTVGQVGLLGDRAHRGELVGGEPHRRDVARRGEHLDVVDRVAHRGARGRVSPSCWIIWVSFTASRLRADRGAGGPALACGGMSRPTAEMIARAPKVLLHDHLDGGLRPATVVELAQEHGYAHLPTTDVARSRHVVQPGRQAQRPRAVPGDVRPHGRGDAAPRRDRAGRLRVRAGSGRGRRACTRRCGWRPSCAPSRA